MKILCVAKNYVDHAIEMGAAKPPSEPVFFLKPDSAMLQKNMPFFYPDFSTEIHHEIEVVVRIEKLGKSIEERFAPKYYTSVALGIDFTARDLQAKAKAAGQPWAVSKGFDGSAVLSDFVPLEKLGKDANNLDFYLLKNGVEVQHGNTNKLVFNINHLISNISKFMTLKTGDLIYTGTPAGVGPVQIGDTLEGFLEGRQLLTCRIK